MKTFSEMQELEKLLQGLGWSLLPDGKMTNADGKVSSAARVGPKASRATAEEWIAYELIKSGKFILSNRFEDILVAYKGILGDGCRSCMTNSMSESLHAYTSKDVAVSQIRSGYKVIARSVVNQKDKKYSRIYGNSHIGLCLSMLGYTKQNSALVGCVLENVFEENVESYNIYYEDSIRDMASKMVEKRSFYLPYIDGGSPNDPFALAVKIKNNEVVICDPSEPGSKTTRSSYSEITRISGDNEADLHIFLQAAWAKAAIEQIRGKVTTDKKIQACDKIAEIIEECIEKSRYIGDGFDICDSQAVRYYSGSTDSFFPTNSAFDYFVERVGHFVSCIIEIQEELDMKEKARNKKDEISIQPTYHECIWTTPGAVVCGSSADNCQQYLYVDTEEQ